MRALLNGEETLIRDAAAALTRDARTRARACLRRTAAPDEPTRSLKCDWAGLGIPEARGGSGGSLVGAALLMQELGRSLEPTAFTSEFVARHAIAAAGIELGTAADAALAADPCADITISRDGRANGELAAVPGALAGSLVLCGDGHGGLVVVEAASAEPVDGVDPLRPAARVIVQDSPVRRATAPERARAVGAALVAAELCGAARGAVELAVQYAQDRTQFGRQIGSFQAIAHRLADSSAALEAAWSLVLYACWAAEAGIADAPQASHAAKASAGDAALFAAESCIQTHGGMGITYEADPHLYLRRALFGDAWFGAAPQHRRALGRLLLDR